MLWIIMLRLPTKSIDTCEVFKNILSCRLTVEFSLHLKSSNSPLEPLLHHLYVNL